MKEKLDYVDRHDIKGIKFGLDNILELLNSFGNPHKKLNVIHIAGTNGKGSVGAYLSYVLKEAGLKVGRLSSPAVFSDLDFAQLCSNDITNTVKSNTGIYNIERKYVEEKLEYINELKLDGNPSGFEIQVAISLLYFLENNCDIVIVEVGMGGEEDATNIFSQSICDVITHIDMDHMNMLGDTIEEIAFNKCGIIKNGSSVVTTSSNEKVMNVIECCCKEKKADLHVAKLSDCTDIDLKLNSNVFRYKNKIFMLTQNGMYQIENAIIAIEVVKVLQKRGYNIREEDIYIGLKNAVLKGRFYELLIKRNESVVSILTDGAHNVNGVEALLKSIESYYDKNIIFVTSIFKDKEYKRMLSLMSLRGKAIVIFETSNPRSISSDDILEIKEIKRHNKYKDISYEHICKFNNANVFIEENLEKAIDRAIELNSIYKNDTKIVCSGSLSYMKDLYKYETE